MGKALEFKGFVICWAVKGVRQNQHRIKGAKVKGSMRHSRGTGKGLHSRLAK